MSRLWLLPPTAKAAVPSQPIVRGCARGSTGGTSTRVTRTLAFLAVVLCVIGIADIHAKNPGGKQPFRANGRSHRNSHYVGRMTQDVRRSVELLLRYASFARSTSSSYNARRGVA